MKAFFRTLVRLVTGRIAYERRARMLAVQLASDFAAEVDSLESAAERIAYFLLAGDRPEFPR